MTSIVRLETFLQTQACLSTAVPSTKAVTACDLRALLAFAGNSKYDPIQNWQGFERAPESLGKSQPRQEDAAVTAPHPTLRATRQQVRQLVFNFKNQASIFATINPQVLQSTKLNATLCPVVAWL